MPDIELERFCAERVKACDAKFVFLEKIIDAQVESNKVAVVTAKAELERHIEIYTREHKVLEKEVSALREWRSQLGGIEMELSKVKLGPGVKVGMIIAFAALMITAMSGVVQLLHLIKG